MLREGLVSTIIPVHNRPRMLCEAVDSVLNQTYRPIEIVIVDDGSTDETRGVADALATAHDGIVTALHIANGGPGVAREAGRQIAQGEFIQYLDSDDLLAPRKFEWQVAALGVHPECGVAYGVTQYGSAGAPWKRTGERIERMFPSMLESRWWGTSTPLYRRSLSDRIGAWQPLLAEEDWEYDCRAAALGVRLAYCDAAVSYEREHAGPRLSRQGATDPRKLGDRATAHKLILGHARVEGVARDREEMRHFARELFLLSRQCGAAGLAENSRDLFELARDASEPARACAFDFVAYRALAALVGWPLAGLLACNLDRVRA